MPARTAGLFMPNYWTKGYGQADKTLNSIEPEAYFFSVCKSVTFVNRSQGIQ